MRYRLYRPQLFFHRLLPLIGALFICLFQIGQAQAQVLGLDQNYGSAPPGVRHALGIYFVCGTGGNDNSGSSSTTSATISSVGWPFASKSDSQYQRVDQGWDLQSTPGDAIYAIAPGTIHKSNPDPGGFGNDYPYEELDGSIGGPSNFVYYGHVHYLPDVIDKHVNAGDKIAVTNTTDGQNGSAAPPGWLEIGFAQPNTGAPVQRGSEGSGTQAGQDMKTILSSGQPNASSSSNTTSGGTCCSVNDSNTVTASSGNSDVDMSGDGHNIGVTLYFPGDTKAHPLILFAPGQNQNSKTTGFYAKYLQAIASSGFIVAGINFSDNTSDNALPSEAQDINYVASKISGISQLSGRLSESSIGLLGHSDGGIAALTAEYAQGSTPSSSVGAVMVEDARLDISHGFKYTVSGPPLFVIHGSKDTIEPPANGTMAYNTVQSAYKALGLFIGADHHSYITGGPSVQKGDLNGQDLSTFNPAVDAVTAAFFGRLIGDDTSPDSVLKTAAAKYANEISFTEKGTEPAPTPTPNTNATSGTQPAANSCCPSNGSGGSVTGASTGDSLLQVESGSHTKALFDFFIAHGLTPPQAAGIVGSMMEESGHDLSTTATNPTTGAYGIGQWLGGRLSNLQALAQKNNVPASDFAAQVTYLWYEISNPASGELQGFHALDHVKETSTPQAAADAWEKYFERSGGARLPQREANAVAILAGNGSDSSSGGTTGDTSSASTSASTSCASASGSNIDTNLPTNESADQLISEIQATNHVQFPTGARLTTDIHVTLLAMLLRLAQKYTFWVTQGSHLGGTAVDIQNINVKGVPLGNSWPSSWDSINQDADNFETDVATLEPKSSGHLWLGVPNDHYKSLANAILRNKEPNNLDYQADLDVPYNVIPGYHGTGATAAHFHVACPSAAP